MRQNNRKYLLCKLEKNLGLDKKYKTCFMFFYPDLTKV